MGDEVADPDRDDDGDPAHGRGAALCLMRGRPVRPDLLAETLPGEEPDQVGREQDGHRQGHTRGDEDASHRSAPPSVSTHPEPWSLSRPAATRSRPAERDALTST